MSAEGVKSAVWLYLSCTAAVNILAIILFTIIFRLPWAVRCIRIAEAQRQEKNAAKDDFQKAKSAENEIAKSQNQSQHFGETSNLESQKKRMIGRTRLSIFNDAAEQIMNVSLTLWLTLMVRIIRILFTIFDCLWLVVYWGPFLFVYIVTYIQMFPNIAPLAFRRNVMETDILMVSRIHSVLFWTLTSFVLHSFSSFVLDAVFGAFFVILCDRVYVSVVISLDGIFRIYANGSHIPSFDQKPLNISLSLDLCSFRSSSWCLGSRMRIAEYSEHSGSKLSVCSFSYSPVGGFAHFRACTCLVALRMLTRKVKLQRCIYFVCFWVSLSVYGCQNSGSYEQFKLSAYYYFVRLWESSPTLELAAALGRSTTHVQIFMASWFELVNAKRKEYVRVNPPNGVH